MFRTTISRQAVSTRIPHLFVCAGLATWIQLAPSASAQDSPAGASFRVREAESLSLLTAEGKLLYESDATKRGGYDYCSLANALADRGELREAIRAASKALFLGNQEHNEDLIAQAKRDLAMTYSYAGRLDKAQEYAEGALKHWVRDRSRVHGPVYKTLGDVAARRGRLTEAIEHYKRSAENSSPSFRPLVAIAMANAALASGDREGARRHLAAAESDTTPVVASGVARTRAEIELADGKTEEAVRSFQSVIDRSPPDDPYNVIWGWYGIARARRNAADAPGATAAFGQAVANAERLRAQFRSEEFKTGIFGDLQSVFDDAIAFAVERGEIDRAWALSERSRARALLDMVRGRVDLVSGTTAFAEASAAVMRPADVQAWLQDDEALVEFHTLPLATHVWVVRRNSIAHHKLELGRDAIAAKVAAFRDALASRRGNAASIGEPLRAAVIDPLQLRARERLIIVGHEGLHYLPFQALNGDGRYLIESHTIAYAPSASSFIALRAKTASTRSSVLAFGNPTVPALAPLPGAEREVERIRQVFADTNAAVRDGATKERFVADSARSRYIHVAAHAESDAVDPLRSTLHLAAGKDASGAFEAREAYGLSLAGADLVTLSACETALGTVSRGDEVWGFSRAFLGAGARAVVVSLWPVADESTERLMGRFYEQLKVSDAATAMQDAQVALIRDARFADPFFWAPFNFVGAYVRTGG